MTIDDRYLLVRYNVIIATTCYILYHSKAYFVLLSGDKEDVMVCELLPHPVIYITHVKRGE